MGDWEPEDWREEDDVGGEGRADRPSQESSVICGSDLSSGFPDTLVSTIIVEEAVDPALDIGDGAAGITDSPCAKFLLSSVLAFDPFRSGRVICLLLAPSCVYEGRLALTIFPSASLQSLFLVANTPKPSPPASSSFSLWRAICLSKIIVR